MKSRNFACILLAILMHSCIGNSYAREQAVACGRTSSLGCNPFSPMCGSDENCSASVVRGEGIATSCTGSTAVIPAGARCSPDNPRCASGSICFDNICRPLCCTAIVDSCALVGMPSSQCIEVDPRIGMGVCALSCDWGESQRGCPPTQHCSVLFPQPDRPGICVPAGLLHEGDRCTDPQQCAAGFVCTLEEGCVRQCNTLENGGRCQDGRRCVARIRFEGAPTNFGQCVR